MPDTLAQMIRAKYPGAYDERTDQELETAWERKYPGQYKEVPRTGPRGIVTAPAEREASKVADEEGDIRMASDLPQKGQAGEAMRGTLAAGAAGLSVAPFLTNPVAAAKTLGMSLGGSLLGREVAGKVGSLGELFGAPEGTRQNFERAGGVIGGLAGPLAGPRLAGELLQHAPGAAGKIKLLGNLAGLLTRANRAGAIPTIAAEAEAVAPAVAAEAQAVSQVAKAAPAAVSEARSITPIPPRAATPKAPAPNVESSTLEQQLAASAKMTKGQLKALPAAQALEARIVDLSTRQGLSRGQIEAFLKEQGFRDPDGKVNYAREIVDMVFQGHGLK